MLSQDLPSSQLSTNTERVINQETQVMPSTREEVNCVKGKELICGEIRRSQDQTMGNI